MSSFDTPYWRINRLAAGPEEINWESGHGTEPSIQRHRSLDARTMKLLVKKVFMMRSERKRKRGTVCALQNRG